jgi:radical SAM protein with 4Fe4S-binding SPASM domain
MHSDTLKFYKYVPTIKPQYQGKFCYSPYKNLEIDEDGDVILCGCQLHMPYVIGNIYQNTISEIWQNTQAQTVRDSVASGEFTYCNWACSSLKSLSPRPETIPKVLDFPRHISVKLDLSCNLQCPSCRENKIMEKNTDRIFKQQKVFDEIKDYAIAHPDHIIEVNPLSSGEVFASHSGLHFLKSLIDFPQNNLRLGILTNGTLIYHHRTLIEKISHLIDGIVISIDAATPETYSCVRGGNWEELWAGIDLISQLNLKLFAVNFCVQMSNYHEIEKFAELAFSKKIKNIGYQKLNDFGHWDIKWWQDNNALDRQKTSFESVLTSIEKIKNLYPDKITVAGDIANYLQKRIPLGP